MSLFLCLGWNLCVLENHSSASILDFSNIFINQQYPITDNEEIKVEVYEQGKTTIPMIESIIDDSLSTFILCETNDFAATMFKLSENNKWGFIYTKSLDLSNESFNGTYLNLLEELLRFYFNYRNPVPENTYSIEKIKDFVSDYILDKKLINITKKLKEVDKPILSYIKDLFESMRIRIDDSIYKELGEKLSENVYREHYILKKIDKRIMTIHSSKGLEANKVLLFVCYEDYWYNKNPEDRDGKYRNYFVAFSRAEKELHIFYQAKITKKYGTFDVKQVHIIDKINVAYQQLLSSKKATPSENE